MHRDMEDSPAHALLGRKGGPQHDVTELADGGESEPALQIVLRESDEGRYQDGGAGDPYHELLSVEALQQIDAENIGIHPYHAKHAHLHHSHGMQESRDRRGGHHRVGQPRMERHESGFGETKGEEHEQNERAEFCILRLKTEGFESST